MSRIETLTTLPRVFIATAGTNVVAVISGAYQAAASVHPMQIVVWICTALSFLAAAALACIRGYIELRKYISGRRRAARYRALKAQGKVPLP